MPPTRISLVDGAGGMGGGAGGAGIAGGGGGDGGAGSGGGGEGNMEKRPYEVKRPRKRVSKWATLVTLVRGLLGPSPHARTQLVGSRPGESLAVVIEYIAGTRVYGGESGGERRNASRQGGPL